MHAQTCAIPSPPPPPHTHTQYGHQKSSLYFSTFTLKKKNLAYILNTI